MFMSNEAILADKSIGRSLKSWAAKLNLAAQAVTAPLFALNENTDMLGRVRHARGGGTTTMTAFQMGDKFRVSSVVLEQRMDRNGIEILIILVPQKLAAEVSSVTLPLSEALDLLNGLVEWTEVAIIDAERKTPASVAALPTVEETRSSEEWGAW